MNREARVGCLQQKSGEEKQKGQPTGSHEIGRRTLLHQNHCALRKIYWLAEVEFGFTEYHRQSNRRCQITSRGAIPGGWLTFPALILVCSRSFPIADQQDSINRYCALIDK
jgi:hypothetical protein